MKVALVGTPRGFLADTAPLLGGHGIEVVEDPSAADVALATDWSAAARLADCGASRAALLREDLAQRELDPSDPRWEQARAADAVDLPAIVTAQWLADLDPAAIHVRPGIAPPPARPPSGDTLQLRVRAAGEAIADADVVLDLTKHERLPGSALEGMRHGAVAVVTAAPGREEVVVHGENGLVVAWDDDRGTARALDLLDRDRELLARLRDGAQRTAAEWPSHEDAAAALAGALQAVGG